MNCNCRDWYRGGLAPALMSWLRRSPAAMSSDYLFQILGGRKFLSLSATACSSHHYPRRTPCYGDTSWVTQVSRRKRLSTCVIGMSLKKFRESSSHRWNLHQRETLSTSA